MANVEGYIATAAQIIGTSALSAIQANPTFVSIVAAAIAAGNVGTSDISSLLSNPTIVEIVNQAASSNILSTNVAVPTRRSETRTQTVLSGTRAATTSTTATGTTQATSTSDALHLVMPISMLILFLII